MKECEFIHEPDGRPSLYFDGEDITITYTESWYNVDVSEMIKKNECIELYKAMNNAFGTVEQLQQEREYRTVNYIVTTLANICAGSTDKIIDLLTGYLWDEEEAGMIKEADNTKY